MKETDMMDAIAEAKRFLARIDQYSTHRDDPKAGHRYHSQCPQRAAVRRASMDLTRVLARLRKFS